MVAAGLTVDRRSGTSSREEGIQGGLGAKAVILKSETYNFHRLDLSRQAGFIVTIYDEDGLRLRCNGAALDLRRSLCGSAEDRR